MASTATRSEISDTTLLPAAQAEVGTQQLIPDFTSDSESEFDLKTKIARIAHLPNITDWEIVDRKGKLFLIHYTDDANMRELWWVRGLVVDIETERVIGDSFGYTSYAVCSQIKSVDNHLIIEAVDGVTHTFDLDTAVIKVAYEGVVLRVFWYDNEMWLITHRRMDTKGSRWGRSRPFLEMYKSAGGPSAEELFDTSKPYSSTLYMFMVVDPELITATRQQVEVPYLVHIADMEMDLARPVDEVAPGRFVDPLIQEIPGVVKTSFIHRPPALNLEHANAHLDHGYYCPQKVTDERLTTGEALIIYKVGPNGHVEDVVKVYSPAFYHRFTLRGNNPNLSHQFHTLMDIAGHGKLDEKGWYQFSRQLIVFPAYNIKDIKEMYQNLGAILTLPQQDTTTMADFVHRDQRLHLLWLNFVLALPAPQQAIALEFLEKYGQEKDELASWLKAYELAHEGDALAKAVCEDPIKDFLLAARKQAKIQQQNGRRSAKGAIMGYPTIIKAVIDRHLDRSHGARIYALVRSMKIAKGIIIKPLVPVVVSISESAPSSSTAITQAVLSSTLPSVTSSNSHTATHGFLPADDADVDATLDNEVLIELCSAKGGCSSVCEMPSVEIDQLFTAVETGRGNAATLIDTIFADAKNNRERTTKLIEEIFAYGKEYRKQRTAEILAEMFRQQHADVI